MDKKYDFSGWATKNNLRCADGRTIMPGAFSSSDGETVPLCWSHQHGEVWNVLGHALLENRNEGVYAYCTFNDTENGQNAKALVQHGDIASLSIYANHLKQRGGNVVHGAIREVSLVLAGANPGAKIDMVMEHDEESGECANIWTGEDIELFHEDDDSEGDDDMNENSDDETIKDIVDSMTEKQKKAMYAIVGMAISEKSGDEEDPDMKHNLFDNDDTQGDDTYISRNEELNILKDAKRVGSLREAVLQHGIESLQHAEPDQVAQGAYGIQNIDYLFPEAHSLNNTPAFIQRENAWVSVVMRGTHHTPFSRIKSVFANITEDEARARGYIKGNLKKEEVFPLLRRTTNPCTIYKKQKLDRDDIVDITDFDVVSWLKGEMRMMLNEELARAVLIGDGREPGTEDKISEDNIRPIAFDNPLYTIHVKATVGRGDAPDVKTQKTIDSIIRSRKDYKGSGNPTLFTTDSFVTECLLLKDAIGHDLYTDEAALARKLRVKSIVTVPVMEGAKAKDDDKLIGVIVNLSDYNIGADKGGAVNMMDDFDIDFNQMKYLIETRCSGALTIPYSAMAIEEHIGE